MEYITLDKGIPVWIPVYEASLQFRIAKLGDTLDSLFLLLGFGLHFYLCVSYKE